MAVLKLLANPWKEYPKGWTSLYLLCLLSQHWSPPLCWGGGWSYVPNVWLTAGSSAIENDNLPTLWLAFMASELCPRERNWVSVGSQVQPLLEKTGVGAEHLTAPNSPYHLSSAPGGPGWGGQAASRIIWHSERLSYPSPLAVHFQGG